MARTLLRRDWMAMAAVLSILAAGGAAMAEPPLETHQAPIRSPAVEEPHAGRTRAAPTWACTGTVPANPVVPSRNPDEPKRVEKKAPPRICGLKPPEATATGTEAKPQAVSTGSR